jgi:hypothetical protein
MSMRPFPDQSEQTDAIETTLSCELEFADRLYRFWSDTEKQTEVNKSKLSDEGKLIAFALDVQLSRYFFSAVEQCRRGDAMTANILARSLFETVLATLFILRPYVPIVVDVSIDSYTKMPKVEKDGVTLIYSARKRGRKTKSLNAADRALRADLYYLHAMLNEPKIFERMALIPGMKRFGKAAAKRTKTAFSKMVDSYKAKVQNRWWSVLNNHPYTYSGLTIAELAKSLHRRLDEWYKTIYHVQSGVAHSASALSCLQANEKAETIEPRFFSPIDEIRGALQAAVMIFLISISEWHSHVGFSTGKRMVVRSLIAEFNKVFH